MAAAPRATLPRSAHDDAHRHAHLRCRDSPTKPSASLRPFFNQLGLTVAQGGAGGNLDSPKPAKDWATSLQPGESVAAVLVSGDMTMTGAGTVTYNDGKRVLAFGHPMFNLGPVDMPLAKEEIITTLASSYQPTKMGNASEVVGALRQDRHSAIEGELGATAQMIPVTMHVRSYNEDNTRAQIPRFPLQRLRRSEVDALPDDGDAVQLAFEVERFL